MFDRINAVNYRGSWLVARAALGRMVEQEILRGGEHERVGQRGSVVHIASQLGIVGRPDAGEFFSFSLSASDCLPLYTVTGGGGVEM